ncbi:hypothetical protein ACFE04_011142 [Oxalis oulophora]
MNHKTAIEDINHEPSNRIINHSSSYSEGFKKFNTCSTYFSSLTQQKDFHTDFQGYWQNCIVAYSGIHTQIRAGIKENLQLKLLKIEQPHGLGYINICWQRGSGGYLATTGTDHSVAIFNRSGKLIERLSLPGTIEMWEEGLNHVKTELVLKVALSGKKGPSVTYKTQIGWPKNQWLTAPKDSMVEQRIRES